MSRTRSICMIGLSIALIAVSSWVTIPIGPIPFTLQMFAIPLAIYLLRPSEAIIAVFLYILIGALGLPVFSGMRGGIGVILGPTGGFLMGYLIGVPLACLLLQAVRMRRDARGAAKEVPAQAPADAGAIGFLRTGGWELLAGIVFIACSYAVGCLRYMAVANVDVAVALAACALPFIVPDLVKTVLAILTARLIKVSLGNRYW